MARSVTVVAHDMNTSNDERPIGIFQIDSEISKSLNSLKGLFEFTGHSKSSASSFSKSSKRKNDGESKGGGGEQQVQQQLKRKNNKIHSLLVFCPPSHVSDEDEEESGNKDLFVTPTHNQKQQDLTEPQKQHPAMPQSSAASDRPGPTDQSTAKRAITATPIMITTSGSRSTHRSINVDMPGLVPSTPVLTPVCLDTTPGGGDYLEQSSASASKEGRFFADNVTTTITSRASVTEEDGSIEVGLYNGTPRTSVINCKTTTTGQTQNRRGYSLFSILLITVMILVVLVASYEAVGNKNEHVQNVVSFIEDKGTKYALQAKASINTLLANRDIDLAPITSRFESTLQQTCKASKQALQYTNKEISAFMINTFGEDNIKSVQDTAVEVQTILLTQAQNFMHKVSTVEFDAVEQDHDSTLSGLKAPSTNSKVLQLKASLYEFMSLLMQYCHCFIVCVTDTIGEDNMNHMHMYWMKVEEHVMTIASRLAVCCKESGLVSFEEFHVFVNDVKSQPTEDDIIDFVAAERAVDMTHETAEDFSAEDFSEKDKMCDDLIDAETKSEMSPITEHEAEADTKSPEEANESDPVLVEESSIVPQVSPDIYPPVEVVPHEVLEPVDPLDIDIDVMKNQPSVVVVAVSDWPEDETDFDIAEKASIEGRTPETIVLAEKLEPVATDEEVVVDSDFAEKGHNNIEEDHQESDASIVDDVSDFNLEEPIQHILHDGDLHEIMVRMERARARMLEEVPADEVDFSEWYGLFQRFSKRGANDE